MGDLHSKLINNRHNQTNEKFIRRMDAAMEVSYHKYGDVKAAYPHEYSAIKELKHRLRRYEETGNLDYLVDVANYAMIEFTYPARADAHDSPTDGGEGRYRHGGGLPIERKNHK